MLRTCSYQITAMQNLDRLLLKSMLGMAERHLTARWVESVVAPTVVIADADTAEGFDALTKAKVGGLVPLAITTRPSTQWVFEMRKPLQSRDLLQLLNQIDAQQARRFEELKPKGISVEQAKTRVSDAHLLRKAGNLFDYLSRGGPRGIVEVRFAPGKWVMFNHVEGELVSALSNSQLLQMVKHPVQETAHGAGQATSEWNIARRVLPVRVIEDLAWQVVVNHSRGQLLTEIGQTQHLAARMPRLSSVQMTPAQISMTRMLMRTPLDVRTLARNCGTDLAQAVDVCNALFACGLLSAPRTPQLSGNSVSLLARKF